MSGLIWSGIGQGIAGAGQAFASSMFKDIEYQRQLEAEQRREESALKRLEEADRIKSEREDAKAEALKQRVARESAEVETKAAERGTRRNTELAAQDLSRLMTASSMTSGGEMGSEEDFKRLLADPRNREVYEKAGLIEKRMDNRLQRADDETQSALEMGAHSSVIEAYSKKRTEVLKQIQEENKQRNEERRAEQNDRRLSQQDERLDLLDKRITSQNTTDKQRADAATTTAKASETRANAGTTVRGQEYRTANDFTSRERTLRTQIGKAFGEEKKNLQSELDKLLDARKNWEAGRSSGTAAATPAARPASPSSNATTTKNYSNLWK